MRRQSTTKKGRKNKQAKSVFLFNETINLNPSAVFLCWCVGLFMDRALGSRDKPTSISISRETFPPPIRHGINSHGRLCRSGESVIKQSLLRVRLSTSGKSSPHR